MIAHDNLYIYPMHFFLPMPKSYCNSYIDIEENWVEMIANLETSMSIATTFI